MHKIGKKLKLLFFFLIFAREKGGGGFSPLSPSLVAPLVLSNLLAQLFLLKLRVVKRSILFTAKYFYLD